MLRSGDVLVHHPYDSFATSVEAFVEQAAATRDVLAIKQTLYRTVGDESPIVAVARPRGRSGQAGRGARRAQGALRRAGEHRAGPARSKQAGVHVVYGLVGLKTHAKIAARRAPGGRRHPPLLPRRHRQLQPEDGRALYEDLGLLSADPELGADLTELFNYLTGYSRQAQYRQAARRAGDLRDALLELIREETEAGPTAAS